MLNLLAVLQKLSLKICLDKVWYIQSVKQIRRVFGDN